jgi:hypothetical protein
MAAETEKTRRLRALITTRSRLFWRLQGDVAMSSQSKKPVRSTCDRSCDDLFDLDTLLHPAGAFAHPSDVLRDPDLTLNEKRAILASWASDACAVEAAPALRQAPGAARPVSFDVVMDALRLLDRQASEYQPPRHYRRGLANRIPGVLGLKSGRGPTTPDGEGQPLN